MGAEGTFALSTPPVALPVVILIIASARARRGVFALPPLLGVVVVAAAAAAAAVVTSRAAEDEDGEEDEGGEARNLLPGPKANSVGMLIYVAKTGRKIRFFIWSHPSRPFFPANLFIPCPTLRIASSAVARSIRCHPSASHSVIMYVCSQERYRENDDIRDTVSSGCHRPLQMNDPPFRHPCRPPFDQICQCNHCGCSEKREDMTSDIASSRCH